MLKGTKMNRIPKEERKTLRCKGCEQYLLTDCFTTEGKTTAGRLKFRSRCKQCYNEYRKGKDPIHQLIQESKEKCGICGYDKFKGSLDFHHKEPKDKKFEMSDAKIRSISIEEVKEEIEKCVVLCSNCHREVHGGVTTLKEF